MIETRITKLLGIQYPVIQGGMAWVSDACLAAAVSNGGGLGLIAAANAPVEVVRAEIEKAKQLTNRPFGVNIMLMSPYAEEIADLVVETGVKVVTTGAGSPGKYMERWKQAGITVIPVIPSVALAKRMERAGADAVVAEGTESGGHVGETTTMALVPQVVDAVEIPVIAAGGIADGRGVAATLALGAEGVQMGTVFVASEECTVHENFKQMILKAKDTDTAVTGRNAGAPVRTIRNKLTKKLQEMEKKDTPFEEMEAFTVGSLRKAARDGNKEEGSFMAGQISGMITQIRPAKEIIQSVMAGAEETIKKMGGVFVE